MIRFQGCHAASSPDAGGRPAARVLRRIAEMIRWQDAAIGR
jgi:hypothetical protein